MLSVGKVSKMFGISRTALLYYDSTGLLKPSERNRAGYRQYSEADMDKLSQIMLYRQVGIPLSEIESLIPCEGNHTSATLLKRLGDLVNEISKIKDQQNVIIKILKRQELLNNFHTMDKEKWEEILNLAGIDTSTGDHWHADFEKHSPDQHQIFLEALGFKPKEIDSIRKYYKNYYESDER